MRKLFVIGIGAGNPDHLTVQAISAMNQVDVFFVLDKGADKDELVALRRGICERHIANDSYRIVALEDPARDRNPSEYRRTVAAWHDERSHLYERTIAAELGEDGCGAFLVWGDPSLYDSTLRIVDQIGSRGSLALDVEVIPGITSIQALTEQHRIPLNRIGEPVVITTGRLLAAGGPTITTTTVVMLDASCAFNTLEPDGIVIWWGAYLGTPDEILLSGPLVATGSLIEQVRAEARARKGWIMDIYVLQPSPSAT